MSEFYYEDVEVNVFFDAVEYEESTDTVIDKKNFPEAIGVCVNDDNKIKLFKKKGCGFDDMFNVVAHTLSELGMECNQEDFALKAYGLTSVIYYNFKA